MFMTVRSSETDRIPLKYGTKSVWFLVFDIIDGNVKEETFTQTKKGLVELYERLQKEPSPLRIYAIWHGQWKTDLFSCDRKVLTERLAKLKDVVKPNSEGAEGNPVGAEPEEAG